MAKETKESVKQSLTEYAEMIEDNEFGDILRAHADDDEYLQRTADTINEAHERGIPANSLKAFKEQCTQEYRQKFEREYTDDEDIEQSQNRDGFSRGR